MGNRRGRLTDSELHHYEDNIAVLSRIIKTLRWLLNVVTFHVFDPDVRAIAQEDIKDALKSAESAKAHNISRMRMRKKAAKRARREKREARDL
jgi:hypothetical protein